MRIPLYQIDAFTDKIFGGNPAAVCPLEEWLSDETLQKIAEENNLSETAFFVDDGDFFTIRWFTPKLEIDLAGHPTLAAAHVIFNYLDYTENRINFFSPSSGHLLATCIEDLISLDFPSIKSAKYEASEELIEALGVKPLEIYKARDCLIVLENEEQVRAVKPNFYQLDQLDLMGIIITAKGDKSDFVSRFFAPGAGILEDPVTGSAHSMLIPFWAERLEKNSLYAVQLSERQGELYCENLDSRVIISGKAKTFMIGEIHL
jgi:PhzF family phenazine biosynthesis protein